MFRAAKYFENLEKVIKKSVQMLNFLYDMKCVTDSFEICDY